VTMSVAEREARALFDAGAHRWAPDYERDTMKPISEMSIDELKATLENAQKELATRAQPRRTVEAQRAARAAAKPRRRIVKR
jgi:hypothetical protein